MRTFNIFPDLKQCKIESLTQPGMKRWCPGDRKLSKESFTAWYHQWDMVWLTIRGERFIYTILLIMIKCGSMFGLLVDIAVPISESSLSKVQLYTPWAVRLSIMNNFDNNNRRILFFNNYQLILSCWTRSQLEENMLICIEWEYTTLTAPLQCSVKHFRW